jgi:hypothetical protein
MDALERFIWAGSETSFRLLRTMLDPQAQEIQP